MLDHLWATKYVPELNGKIQHEAERRADAFSDMPFTTFGEELRQMTPKDLVFLEGMDNPFVAGGPELTFGDSAFFLWHLNALNEPERPLVNAFRRGKFKARISARAEEHGEDVAIAEIFAYIDRIFIDLPSPDPKDKTDTKPPTVHCVAPLLIDVASVIGPRDPMNGKMLGDTPIPRLIQYRSAAQQRGGGEKFTALDSANVACMAEANEVMREYRESKKIA